jgi:hypothetical protein
MWNWGNGRVQAPDSDTASQAPSEEASQASMSRSASECR